MPLPNIDELLASASLKGMVASEVAIMKMWIARNSPNFDRIDFEVRLGQGGDPQSWMTDEQAAQYKYLTMKRADAIAYVGDHALIIEVKKRLGIRDAGQLLTYRLLWMHEHPGAPEPSMVAIGYRADQDVRLSLTSHGINVELYPDDGSAPF
jgi:hypothetical protein